MAPYPEEIDVFSAPHSRMKELVDVYSEKLTCTDFADWVALESLLQDLHHAFCEFRSHEQIENRYILKKLKNRLKVLKLEEAAVCNCHSDNRLAEMLALVEDGWKYRTETERLRFGMQLREALMEFTGSFLPHMKEEEEVFQPMLMKYFGYEELKCLKQQVILEHLKEKIVLEDSQADKKSDTYTNELPLLPPEIMSNVLKWLPPNERLRCARVCRQWQELVMTPSLWANIYPVYWIHGIWENVYEDEDHKERILRLYGDTSTKPLRDEDADVGDEGEQEEITKLRGFIKYFLPRVGVGVRKIVLASCRGLNSSMLRSILRLCPNLTYLDVSYTAIMDSAFKGLKESGSLQYLQYLDLSGCSWLSDLALLRLAEIMKNDWNDNGYRNNWEIEDSFNYHDDLCSSICPFQQGSVLCRLTRLQLKCPRGLSPCCTRNKNTLLHLNLSGCSKITDRGLRCLFEVGVLDNINYLDLSGCWGMDGMELSEMVGQLPFLRPECLSYCDNVTNGPHPSTANGCQNVGQPHLQCCRKDLDN